MLRAPNASRIGPQLASSRPRRTRRPQQRHQPGLDHHARQHGADAAGRLGVGVGQPGVHRDHGDLDAEADEEQRPGGEERQRESVPWPARSRSCAKVQRAGLGEDQRDAEQHEHGPTAALHQVLHAGLQRGGLLAVEGHQHVGGHGHGLEPDPQVEQVCRAAQPDHGPDHGDEQGVVLLLLSSDRCRGPRRARPAIPGRARRRQQKADPVDAQRDDAVGEVRGVAGGQVSPRQGKGGRSPPRARRMPPSGWGSPSVRDAGPRAEPLGCLPGCRSGVPVHETLDHAADDVDQRRGSKREDDQIQPGLHAQPPQRHGDQHGHDGQ